MGKELVRLIKYCIVGASSFLVGLLTFNVSWILLHIFPVCKAVFPVCNALAYVVSVLNGFLLNRSWTFSDKRGHSVWQQAGRFAIVNIIGWAMNTVVIAAIVASAMSLHESHNFFHRAVGVALDLLTGRSKAHYSLLLLNAAGVVATGIVLVWNWLGNRHWSFRK